MVSFIHQTHYARVNSPNCALDMRQVGPHNWSQELLAQSVPVHLSTVNCQAMSLVLHPFSTFLIFRFALLFQPAAFDTPH